MSQITESFHELPVESHEHFRDSLMFHVSQLEMGAQFSRLRRQLCVALVDFALQMTTWKIAANDVLQRLGDGRAHVVSLLETLRVFPEEVSADHVSVHALWDFENIRKLQVRNERLRLGTNRRHQLIGELQEIGDKVVKVLVGDC